MFSLSLEFFKNGVENKTQTPRIATFNRGAKLTLPLERTALEQINYTKWFYSEDSKRLLKTIRDSYVTDKPNGYLQINEIENSFAVNIPINVTSDEFFFLLDYIKERILNKGFVLRDAIQEAISNETSYIEFEIFYLFNPVTQQYVTLEIRSYKGIPQNITGSCSSSTKDQLSIVKTNFLDIVRAIFDL